MKQNKKNNFHISKLKFLYILNALSLVLILILGGLGYLLWKSHEQVLNNPGMVSNLFIQAVDGLTKPVNIDAKTGVGYMYESRMSLPVSPELNASLFSYGYQPAQSEGDFPEMVSIAYKPKVEEAKVHVLVAQNMMDSLESVPKLQACARGYKIYFALQDETSDLKMFEKTLQDGRRIYVYKEDACMEDNHDEIVSYLQQIESY